MSSENQWAAAASDIGNVLAGTALRALLGGSGAAQGFSIDYERAPQAIATPDRPGHGPDTASPPDPHNSL